MTAYYTQSMLLAALILTTLFPTTRVEYAAADGGGGMRIAVHGVETDDGSTDFSHSFADVVVWLIWTKASARLPRIDTIPPH